MSHPSPGFDTLSPSDGERDGVRGGSWAGVRADQQIKFPLAPNTRHSPRTTPKQNDDTIVSDFDQLGTTTFRPVRCNAAWLSASGRGRTRRLGLRLVLAFGIEIGCQLFLRHGAFNPIGRHFGFRNPKDRIQDDGAEAVVGPKLL